MMQGGFRCKWLARLTRGRIGLGRWTKAEVEQINRHAEVRAREFAELIGDDCGCPQPLVAGCDHDDDVLETQSGGPNESDRRSPGLPGPA